MTNNPLLWRVPNWSNKRTVIVSKDSPESLLYKQAEIINDKNQSFKFYSEMDKKIVSTWDAIPTSTLLPLIGPRIQNILNNYVDQTQFEYIKATVICNEGILCNFKVLHILNTISAIDLDKSDVMYSESKHVLSIDKICYKQDIMTGYVIGREQSFKPHILISSNLAKIFIKHKLKGISLI